MLPARLAGCIKPESGTKKRKLSEEWKNDSLRFF
jgi:hypothetical protein